ncbi:probable G-protein coupled receptor 141 [Dermochelys coriacea]|uniref:probable G-protein coupled receptor 141 n=1 Tax=Dermochelys coriacea TaxID=27794 RepID=UPI0018E8A45C|nr:probable G-protein coupled receptor 141 [Dermochelys coriacea]XP_043364668.1 probable G-protein coupled receptor 141 [Dermochelys coriacea]XP_043364669.1 probable G-protein coupled receptor 141 [Dermochelys coriacea]XP_043364670.1 probable G-protein coupled receptor 141 [Dermochelys coriacea]XP_043364671.1 probable G-protein coupled receptor 141 [Dermochelys coriacea]
MPGETTTLLNASVGTPQAGTIHSDIARYILITIYTVAFIGGTIGAIAMSFLLVKMNTLSVTTAAIVNLVVLHCLVLLTVPFRLYYYISQKWILGLAFCKAVSAMMHIHMYLTLLFYIITVVIRWLIFFQWKDKVEFYRKLHAVAASATVWIVALVIVLPLFSARYGMSGEYGNTTCFTFQQELKEESVKALNYVIIATVTATTCVLLGLQVFIILKVVKKLPGSVWSHQEFWAQIKSLMFISVIIVCFLPYHLFRLYYIQHMKEKQLEIYNDICLSITAISTLDLLSFVISGSRFFKQKIIMLRDKLACC